MERRINLDNQDITMPLNNPIQGLNGKIPLETLTLVERIKELEVLVKRIKELEVLFEQLAKDLIKQQSELVNLKTFIGFNE